MVQVHDELLFEVEREALTQTVVIVRECMERSFQLTVATPVRLSVGQSWGQLSLLTGD